MKDKKSNIRKRVKKARNEIHAEILEDDVDKFAIIKRMEDAFMKWKDEVKKITKVEALLRKVIETAHANCDELE